MCPHFFLSSKNQSFQCKVTQPLLDLNMVHLRCTIFSFPLVLNSCFGEGQVSPWVLGKDTWSWSCPLCWSTPQRFASPSLVLTIHRPAVVSHRQVHASCIFLVGSKPRLLRTCQLIPSHFCNYCGCHGNSLAVLCHHHGEDRIVWDSMKLCSYWQPILQPRAMLEAGQRGLWAVVQEERGTVSSAPGVLSAH